MSPAVLAALRGSITPSSAVALLKAGDRHQQVCADTAKRWRKRRGPCRLHRSVNESLSCPCRVDVYTDAKDPSRYEARGATGEV